MVVKALDVDIVHWLACVALRDSMREALGMGLRLRVDHRMNLPSFIDHRLACVDPIGQDLGGICIFPRLRPGELELTLHLFEGRELRLDLLLLCLLIGFVFLDLSFRAPLLRGGFH